MEQSDLSDEPADAGILNQVLVRLRLNGLDRLTAAASFLAAILQSPKVDIGYCRLVYAYGIG